MSGRSVVRYWLALIVMAGLLSCYAWYRDWYGQYQRYETSEMQVRQLRAELETHKRQEASLEHDVTNLDKDPIEWEAAIRRSKGWVRPGDKIYRVEFGTEQGRSK